MCVLSIKVPVQKKSGNLFNDPRMYEKWRHSWSQYNNWMVKEIWSVYKDLDDQARSSRPKTIDSEAVFQTHRGKSGE